MIQQCSVPFTYMYCTCVLSCYSLSNLSISHDDTTIVCPFLYTSTNVCYHISLHLTCPQVTMTQQFSVPFTSCYVMYALLHSAGLTCIKNFVAWYLAAVDLYETEPLRLPRTWLYIC